MDPLDELREIFPAERLFDGATQLAAYATDGLTTYRALPRAVVLPETREEVIAAVRWCHRRRVPFVARGSGTSLSGGSVPVPEGLVIALNRMSRILRLDPRQRLAVVEPGVINLEVSRAAEPHGLYYAPDPSSQQICTIGGNVAFNSGGAHCLRYGMTANHVLGLEVVLPDGQVERLGGESLEGVGPDLTGFFCGHEGLFGIALEITLRLLPRPEAVRTVLAAYPSLEAAGHAVAAVVASGLLPAALEIMDRLIIEAAKKAVGASYPDSAALLIVELEGDTAAVESELRVLRQVMDGTGAVEMRLAGSAAERAAIWKGRKSAFSAVGRLAPEYIVQDGVVPRARLGEALREIEAIAGRHGIRVANVFHAGDGNLHPLILIDRPQEEAAAERVAADILDLCVRLGGSVTGEHGIGLDKKAYMDRMFAPRDLEVMERLRAAVDPERLANRGKMLPDGEAPALTSRGPHPLERAGVLSRE